MLKRPKGATMYNVAVDVGGTFTDVLVFDEETGGLTEGKVLSTPEDPSKGVVEGIEAVCEKIGISFPDLHLFFHGTTVVTNMILTNTGSRVGLLTTKGHEQILHLARAWTPGPLYGWMAHQKPDPPADPTDTVGVSERISSSGEVDEDGSVDAGVTGSRREEIKASRGESPGFDHGDLPPLDEQRRMIAETRRKFNEWLSGELGKARGNGR
jgi:N-methylhydantoinase A/oxoprolinase/acetone carboxylase beta subunit